MSKVLGQQVGPRDLAREEFRGFSGQGLRGILIVPRNLLCERVAITGDSLIAHGLIKPCDLALATEVGDYSIRRPDVKASKSLGILSPDKSTHTMDRQSYREDGGGHGKVKCVSVGRRMIVLRDTQAIPKAHRATCIGADLNQALHLLNQVTSPGRNSQATKEKMADGKLRVQPQAIRIKFYPPYSRVDCRTLGGTRVVVVVICVRHGGCLGPMPAVLDNQLTLPADREVF